MLLGQYLLHHQLDIFVQLTDFLGSDVLIGIQFCVLNMLELHILRRILHFVETGNRTTEY